MALKRKWVSMYLYGCFPKIGGFPPKSSILIGFSIIFSIHFGVPVFLETPIYNPTSWGYFTPLKHICFFIGPFVGAPCISTFIIGSGAHYG